MCLGCGGKADSGTEGRAEGRKNREQVGMRAGCWQSPQTAERWGYGSSRQSRMWNPAVGHRITCFHSVKSNSEELQENQAVPYQLALLVSSKPSSGGMQASSFLTWALLPQYYTHMSHVQTWFKAFHHQGDTHALVQNTKHVKTSQDQRA